MSFFAVRICLVGDTRHATYAALGKVAPIAATPIGSSAEGFGSSITMAQLAPPPFDLPSLCCSCKNYQITSETCPALPTIVVGTARHSGLQTGTPIIPDSHKTALLRGSSCSY